MTEVKYKLGNKTMTVGYDSLGITKITRECLEILIEKQIPKKPILVKFDFDNTTVAYCPNCNSSFGEIKPKECVQIHTMKWFFNNGRKESYCECCGQNLDWSDENDRED